MKKKTRSGSKSTSPRRRQQARSRLQYDVCEPRQLLAGIAFNADTGELFIGGLPTRDSAVVSQSGSDLTILLNRVTSQPFDAASVNQITFVGDGGDDSFNNNTAIPSRAYGGGGNDRLQGGSGNDVLVGGLGDDYIQGRDGDDIMRAGGGVGLDFLSGGDGNDTLFGGAQHSDLYGGSGNDRIYGGAGNDDIYGFAGDDLLFPGRGNNYVNGGYGDDLIITGGGNNIVSAGFGSDRVYAGTGNDQIYGEDGDDFLFGGGGDDFIRGGRGVDLIRGGQGSDDIGADDGVEGLRERLFGGAGDDFITGSAFGDYLNGGDGNDRIDGSSGDDLIFGRGGDDNLRGDFGNDLIFGGAGDDYIDGDSGDDFVYGEDGDDNVSGGADADLVHGGRGDDIVTGSSGDDQLEGGLGNDSIAGGSGLDVIRFARRMGAYSFTGGNERVITDKIGDEGLNTVVESERFRFADVNVLVENVPLEPERVTIRPIIVANSDGSNRANFLGTAAQEEDMKSQIDAIYAQADIDIDWETPTFFNNTFANVGNGGFRPASDLNAIIASGDAAGVGSPDSTVIDMYFVRIAPTSGQAPENDARGYALFEEGGAAFFVGSQISNDNRDRLATGIAQDIGVNLGLSLIGDSNNLMSVNLNGRNLNPSQINLTLDSELSQPIE